MNPSRSASAFSSVASIKALPLTLVAAQALAMALASLMGQRLTLAHTQS
jgi:hypothetical protein